MNALKTLRKSLGLSQCSLAKRLGVTRRTVCNWEASETPPRVVMLAIETVSRSLSSAAKNRAEESGEI